MSVPPFMAMMPPPLPPGWTEHRAPAGQIYYHNAQTNESTYIRPVPSYSMIQPPGKAKQKKEKPLSKTPVPNTDWLRVKTTEGNVFYTHKVKKESVWTVPDEIKDAVAALEKEEAEHQQGNDNKSSIKKAEEQEVERIKSEVQELVKRKAEDPVPLTEVIITKKARTEESAAEQEEDGEDESEDSEEEEWQKEAAIQLAAEAEEEKRRLEEEEKRVEEEARAEAAKAKEVQLNIPNRVELSVDEAKALFKTLLQEKDINPLHPWDTSLPLFISDPRYVLLPSVSARKEAFDEYCRNRARELRQSNVKKEKETSDPSEEFGRLLTDEVKSTRTSWNDFRRQWKKDRRFWGWGRDEREREKRFRTFIRELGEKKKAAAEKAEVDFFALLKESGLVTPGSAWKDVKRSLVRDPRYDAVGSSSLREELYHTFLKALTNQTEEVPGKQGQPSSVTLESSTDPDKKEADQARTRLEKRERALQEREEKIKAKRDQLEADIGRSRIGLDREEGEREFRTLLTDAIRDPQTTWDGVLPQLKTDPRFTRSLLPLQQQLRIFHDFIGKLQSKHINNLHALFESHAPSLATSFEDLPLSTLLSSPPVVKLGFDEDRLKHDFDVWQRDRNTVARKAFDEMLSENSFIDFWGRLGKIGGEGVNGGVKADDDLPEGEGEGGGGTVDMKELAKHVDVQEMEKVLKNDRRYIVFNHVPQQRERWLRNYLSNLSAPQLSVHLPVQT